MKRKAKISILCALSCLLCGCSDGVNSPLQNIDTAMGTIITQTLYPAENDAGEITQISEDILHIISDLEESVLSRRITSSEVGMVNAAAGSDHGITVSNKLQNILEVCRDVSRSSAGAFDITIGEVIRLWDIDSWAGEEDLSSYSLPSREEIENALKVTGYDRLSWEGNQLFLPEGMQLDLGAVGKGIALDEIKTVLQQQTDVKGAIISVGGSVLTYGKKENGTPWKVAVVNPLDPAGNIGYLSLNGTWCVSTSGNYERFVEIDGIRYHHIIDSQTGYPVDNEITGVTILSENGLLSDALSTACFVLGIEKGMDLAEYYGVEALFVDREGKLYMTEGMEEYFHG